MLKDDFCLSQWLAKSRQCRWESTKTDDNRQKDENRKVSTIGQIVKNKNKSTKIDGYRKVSIIRQIEKIDENRRKSEQKDESRDIDE